MRARTGPVAVAVAAALATWSWATFVSNVPVSGFDRVRARDRTGLLIADWRFFAPRPAVHDFHVIYRVAGPGPAPGPWRDAPPTTARSVWWHVLLNPHKRRFKELFDVAGVIVNSEGRSLREIAATPAYQLLLGYVVRQARAREPQGCSVQFAVVRFTGFDDDGVPEYLFASAVHEIPR